MKDGLVRADTLPLVFRAVGAEQLGRGTGVRVRIGAIDLLTLDVAASVIARLDAAPAAARDAAAAATTTRRERRPARDRHRRRARGSGVEPDPIAAAPA
jgi:hypothetical protein